jgi:hypothetical protein
MKREPFRHIFVKYSSINFVKTPLPVGDKFHADGQKDMTKLTVAFRKFANAPKLR